MKAILTPEISPKLGIVLFKPGPNLLPLFRGRVLVSPAPACLAHLPSGQIPDNSVSIGDTAEIPDYVAAGAFTTVTTLKVDPESPESFMLRPKRRRWENEKYTRWVKTQPCMCCGKQADDPHHVIGYGLGGMATKAHDIFVIPLCRAHHDELHADVTTFEDKHGSQLELVARFLDHAFAVGVLGTDKK